MCALGLVLGSIFGCKENMLCVVYLQLERTANIRADDQHQYIFHNHHTKKGILQHFHLIFKSALKDSDRHALVVLRKGKRREREGEDLGCSTCVCSCAGHGAGELTAALLLTAASRRRRPLSKLLVPCEGKETCNAETVITLTASTS